MNASGPQTAMLCAIVLPAPFRVISQMKKNVVSGARSRSS
jgi:hypothetical protein